MSIPNRPGSRAENLYGNMIGQETATPPEQPQSRIEEYLDYILKNGTEAEQQIIEDVEALKGIGRYLSMWNGATGLPTTNPKKTPYKYKAGDYYIVSNIGATNYMPSGTQYDGTASTTIDADAKVNDYYIFDGTTWSRLDHSTVESVFVATYTQGANNAWSCDKTFAEIKAAYDAGKLCFANFGSLNRNVGYIRGITDSRIDWIFVYIDGYGDGNIRYQYVYHNNDNTFSTAVGYSGTLPHVTSSDNGKVLGVSNGQWDKVDIHDPVEFTFDISMDPPASSYILSNLSLTNQQIYDAIDAGKFVYGRSNDGAEWLLTQVGHSNNAINYAEFTNIGLYDTLETLTTLHTLRRELIFNGSSSAYISWTNIDGQDGQDGAPGQDGVGVPIGGTTGQVLKKASDSDYDCEWANESGVGVPIGGTTGQVLKKASNSDFDCVWANESGGGSSDVMVVHYTYDSTEYKVVCDYTYNAIMGAIRDGTPIVATYIDPDLTATLYSVTVDPANNIEFVGWRPGFSDHIRAKVVHTSNNVIAYSKYADRPIEFNLTLTSTYGLTTGLTSCDLDSLVPSSMWGTLQWLVNGGAGRALCANVTITDTNPLDALAHIIVKYYCDDITVSGNVYGFSFRSDDGASLTFIADVTDPSNIVYTTQGNEVVLSTAYRYGMTAQMMSEAISALSGRFLIDSSGQRAGQDIVCFPLYPATQKFLGAAMTSLGTDVTITYDTTDDPDFTLNVDFIKYPWIVIPTVDAQTFDGTQQCLYLTRKFYITNYMSEYLECKFPFNYSNTVFMIDIKTMTISYNNNSPTVTITGNATTI